MWFIIGDEKTILANTASIVPHMLCNQRVGCYNFTDHHYSMHFFQGSRSVYLPAAFPQPLFFLTGGLAEEVDEKVMHAAFIPFGDITDIQIPLDYETGKDENESQMFPSDRRCRYKNGLIILLVFLLIYRKAPRFRIYWVWIGRGMCWLVSPFVLCCCHLVGHDCYQTCLLSFVLSKDAAAAIDNMVS